MAPKAKQDKSKDKARLEKNKQKVEDKTFGLKNKNKSSKVQQYVKQMEKGVDDMARRKNLATDGAKKDKKKAEEERQKELAELFAVAIKQPKVPPGVDPKSIVCEYFKAGQCAKGFKCKFSHDLKADRKGGKASAFEGEGEEGKEGGMEDWDQEKLESVVKQKHGAEGGGGNTKKETKIICKFFLDALEKKQYGWFWQCPNGKDCQYKHALPPGYVLKSQMKELLEAEAATKLSVEEEIEEARAKVDAKTPITEAVFQEWRRGQDAKRAESRAKAEEERRRRGVLTGREIFAEEGFVAADDVGASDEWLLRERDEEAEFAREAAAAEARAAASRAEGGLHAGDGRNVEPPEAANGHRSHAASGEGPSAAHGLTPEEEAAVFEGSSDDDDIDEDELDALEESLAAKARVGD